MQNVSGQSIYEKYDIYRSPFRVFINKFSFTLTTGYSRNTYAHDLSGVFFYQDPVSQFVFSNGENPGPTITGFTDWLNNPQPGVETSIENPFLVPFDYLANPVNNPLLGNQTLLVDTDSIPLGFRGVSGGIPVSLNLHYNFLDFRIGGGFTWERQFVRELEPTSLQGQVRNYQPNFKSTSYTRFYGLVGYRFYQFWTYDFVAELMVGKFGQGKQFDGSAISKGLFTNFGISIENNWSEYFRVIIKPSIDFKKHTINLPDGATISHRTPSFFIQVGLSINIPEIPRSPMKSDHVQLKHIYTDPKTGKLKEVRGQPLWKRQNPKVGENHRRLWRYKWKNRKKLNPY
ncbi:MAG: hypothetical protein AAGA66_16215 [Bacteroidota bacterium]